MKLASLAQTACFFYMFCSLPETFGRIEVMELPPLSISAWQCPTKPLQGSTLQRLFCLPRYWQTSREQHVVCRFPCVVLGHWLDLDREQTVGAPREHGQARSSEGEPEEELTTQNGYQKLCPS